MQDDRPSLPQYTGTGQKVAIPRLERRDPDPIMAAAEKHRVIKACTSCRKRKVKCTGELPRCKNCEASDSGCVYEQARKDRLKTAREQNHVLIALLKDVSFRVTEEDKRRIDATLETVEDEPAAALAASSAAKASGKRARKESPSDEGPGGIPTGALGEARAPASVGSNEDMDLLDEDLLRSRESRETGFVGQNSEVQWLRSLQRQMGTTEDEPYGLPYGPPGASNEAASKRISAMHERRKSAKLGNIQHVADSSFYLDSDSLEVETMLDPYELPSPEIAEKLFSCYIDTVHGSFPMIEDKFEEQFYNYIDSIRRHQQWKVAEKWQAVLNLVFAIGAQYSHLTNASWQGDPRDHLLYMTRAVRILGVKDTTMIISAPDLYLIQATGLLSFYYLVIGHVSRAWVMIGISLRFALAVGLHLRNEDPSAPPDRKESLVRIWWSLHSVECLLSSITGRPCIIDNEDCTVPVPQLLPEEKGHRKSSSSRASRPTKDFMTMTSSTTSPAVASSLSLDRQEGRVAAGPFLEAHIRIGLTTRKVLKNLYSARTASVSWERIQCLITELRAELDHWATGALPGGATSPNLSLDFNSDREKLLLGFYYHSIKILITRPCLCRLERRIQGQSDGSSNFNQRMAEACVQAAQSLTLLLPDQPDPVYIYQKGPWWSIIHNIMQAMAVFLLEMLYRDTHMTTRDNENITKCIKKLLRWLRSLRVKNAVASRAYKLVINILKSGESRVKADITDLLAEDEAEIDRGQHFQAYTPASHQPALSAESEFGIGGGEGAGGTWQPQPSYYDPGDYGQMGDPYLFQEQGMGGFQMPMAYGNPFLNHLDQGNPISMSMNMEDLWRTGEEEQSQGFEPGFEPRQGQERPR